MRCAVCAAEFACEPLGDCWCKQVEAKLPVPERAAACLCPVHLHEALASEVLNPAQAPKLASELLDEQQFEENHSCRKSER